MDFWNAPARGMVGWGGRRVGGGAERMRGARRFKGALRGRAFPLGEGGRGVVCWHGAVCIAEPASGNDRSGLEGKARSIELRQVVHMSPRVRPRICDCGQPGKAVSDRGKGGSPRRVSFPARTSRGVRAGRGR